jgi:hypothetical protein
MMGWIFDSGSAGQGLDAASSFRNTGEPQDLIVADFEE